jgi:hypothetical protein
LDPNEKFELNEKSRYFSLFSEGKVVNVKIYTYLESTRLDLQNDMHINEFCKESNFLIRKTFFDSP